MGPALWLLGLEAEQLARLGPRGIAHHDSRAEADDLAPHGTRYHIPVADGQEGDGDQPQRVRKVPGGIDFLPAGKGRLVLNPTLLASLPCPYISSIPKSTRTESR